MSVISSDQASHVSWRVDSPHSPAWQALDIPERNWYAPCKLAGDMAAAIILLVATLPLLLLAAVLVKLTSRGPIIYSQTRLGRNGRPFSIYKIRTMRHNCESVTGARWSTPGDDRVTWIGRILRKTHIDELPQLWNVLRGEMSLVGPRPERPEFIPALQKVLPLYGSRLLVRPGITGLAQIQLPPDTDIPSVRRKLAHDIYYVRSMGFWLDFRILLATLLNLLFVPAAWTRFLLVLPGGYRVQRAYEQDAGTINPELEMA